MADLLARIVADLADKVWSDDTVVADEVRRGDVEFTEADDGQRHMWLVCPGCATLTVLALRPLQAGKTGHSWEWNGDTAAPTLTPSIHHVGCWHGWLRAGVFVPV